MAGQSVTVPEPLPRSHYFLTVSRGSRMRTVAVRSLVVHLAAVAVPLLFLAGLGSTLYLAVHDDLVQRRFTTDRPDRLWCTDVTEHPTTWIPAVVATVAL